MEINISNYIQTEYSVGVFQALQLAVPAMLCATD